MCARAPADDKCGSPHAPYYGRAWVQKDRQDCGFRRRRREDIGMSEFNSAYLEYLSRVVQLNAVVARVRVAVNKQGNAVILSLPSCHRFAASNGCASPSLHSRLYSL